MTLSGAGGWRVAFLLALGLGAVLLLLYWPATGYDFTYYDDAIYVSANPEVLAGLGGKGVISAFTTTLGGFWIPLTRLSLMADASLFGPGPSGFHFVNILLFSAGSSLLLLVLWRMTGDLLPSAFAAALFALHPMRVESVAWITERKDCLVLLFLALALGAYLRFVRTGKARWMAATSALFALDLMAKAILVTFPLLLLLLDLWPLKRLSPPLPGEGWRAFRGRALLLAREKTPLFLLSAAAALGVFLSFSPGDPDSSPGGQLQRALLSPFVYLRDTFWPAGLHLEFFHPSGTVVRLEIILAAALAHAAFLALALRAFRSRPYLLVGWGWFLVGLLPLGGLVPPGGQWTSDRYVLVSHLGLALAFAWGARDLALGLPRVLRPAGAAAGGAAFLVALAAGTGSLLPSWRDGVALLERTVSLAPREPRARRDLALALEEKGRSGEALGRFREALALPSPPPVHAAFSQEFALFLSRNGRGEEAVALLRELAAAHPGDPGPLASLGRLLVEQGRGTEAVPVLERLLSQTGDPALTGPGHLHLGMALLEGGRREEAIGHFEEAVRLRPEDRVNRLAFARLLLAAGRWKGAEEEFARMAADPGASPNQREAGRAGEREARRKGEGR